MMVAALDPALDGESSSTYHINLQKTAYQESDVFYSSNI